ncbi:MAG: cupin domain-containing protein [Desulfobacterales bacterium]|nr:cupin domain-containing protein [Desulfobacterales bacterium]
MMNMDNDSCVRGNSVSLVYNVDKIKSEQLKDWGEQPECDDVISHSRGLLLWKGSNGRPEAGLWECTPGRWRLSIPADEFCHFISGDALYESVTGDKINVSAGTCVLFPAGWEGTCTVKKTIRNVYMLTI